MVLISEKDNGGNMKKNIAKRCEVCNTKEVKFVQNGLGYCGVSSVLGTMNMFGYCKTKKVESAELKKYVSRMAELGMDY